MIGDGQKLDDDLFRGLGFRAQRLEGVRVYSIGEPHARLFVFEGYSADGDGFDYWACLAKYLNADQAARSCTHVPKRLSKLRDLRLLCRALGVVINDAVVAAGRSR